MSAITINIPDSLYSKIKELTDHDASSVEQFAMLALAEKMSSLVTTEYLEQRAHRAQPGRLHELLSKAPDAEPLPDDKIL
jgi:hypothetical protein